MRKAERWVRRTAAATGVVVALLAVGTATAIAPVGQAAARGPNAGGSATCQHRTLVVSAMPLEISPLLGKLHHRQTVEAASRRFYLGTLRDRPVALAMSGIGPVNARQTTKAALSHLRCHGKKSINSVAFSGVAGGDDIGDVIVPGRWTENGGKHFYGVNGSMRHAARRISRHHRVRLEQKTPIGDPLCTCGETTAGTTTVRVTHRPRIEVGGAGETTDPFSGHRLPCVPGGGDVFGCDPCPAHKQPADEAVETLPGFTAVADPDFFAGYLSTSDSGTYVASDEETAAVDAVAHHHHVPFIGLRGVSDGGGDPLHLPGFPAEFFYYRQLAADNAALATLAFLHAWHGR